MSREIMMREINRLRAIVRKQHKTLSLIEETLPKMGREVLEAYCCCYWEGNTISLRGYVLDALDE